MGSKTEARITLDRHGGTTKRKSLVNTQQPYQQRLSNFTGYMSTHPEHTEEVSKTKKLERRMIRWSCRV